MSSWEDADGRLQDGAIYYANLGWKILPCHGIVGGRCTCGEAHAEPKDKGKHPSITDWNRQASSEVGVVNVWWEREPEGNIAVNCHASGLLVIDIDPRSDGINSFEKLDELLGGELPPTVEASTGEYTAKNGKTLRGRHLFYKCDPREQLVGNLKKSGLPGIDIKHNGYVLISPSRHFSGVCYEWRDGHAPWDIEMAQAPEILLAAIRKGNRKSGTRLGEVDWNEIFNGESFESGVERVDISKMMEEGIDEGSRAVDIYKLTCSLANELGVQNEIQRQSVENLMIRFNAEKVRPPLSLEGQNGLLHHVRRAIEFVRDNPKMKKYNPQVAEWMTDRAKHLQIPQAPTALTGVVQPQSVEPMYDYEDEDSSKLPGTIGGSISAALESGQSVANAGSLSNIDVPKDPDAIREQDGGTPGMRSLSDTGNGRRVVDIFGDGVRYTPGLGWFQWSGAYWKPDNEELGMMELAKRLPPVIAAEVTQYTDPDKQNEVVKWSMQARSNGRLKSAIESANSDPRILVDVDTWDSDAYLLGVANGVIDLRTGELLRGRPDLYITRRAPVAYTQGLRNVRWEQFIDFATGGDKELQDWLQRAAGYSLTGLNKYDIMFLVYGPPGSGKNTMVEALVKCLGTQQYAWPLDSSILAQGDGSASGADLYHWAELRGKRMVWVDELPDSERLKENSVKKLTGSSEISARSPGERPFTFQAQAKLWITTNHRPMINDDAMWRRIRPIPLVRIPEKPDPDLKEYIFDPEGALPAVLSWAIEGAIKLLGSSSRDGLGWCKAVADAAEIYRKNEDRIGIFLSEETREAEGASTPIKSIYAIYRLWSEERGEKPMAQISFQKKLVERNLPVIGVGSRAVVEGRSILPRAVPTGEVDWTMATRFARS